ncbi:MAG: HAMP domain-containing protein [Acidobacteria bacterium]|nr:HAMP domain-containing protein [Acidobacteriota bacterium]
MTLKKKIIFFIAGLGLVFSLLFLLFNHLTISHSKNEQKNIYTAKVAQRLSHVIANEKKRIATLCNDWATWDAMYGYAEKPSKEFEAESLPGSVVPASDLSLILIVGRDRQVIFHQGFDQNSSRFVSFDLGNTSENPLWKSLMLSFSRPEHESFIAATEFGPMIIISAAIMHSDGKGPMNGRVVMGRLVDRSFMQRLGAAIQEKITLLKPANLQKDLAQNELRSLFEADFYFKENKNFLRIYSLFRGPAGQAVFAVRIDADKTLFSLQEKAVRNFLITLLLCSIMAAAIFYGFIDRMLLQRLKNISKKTMHITSFEDLTVRIHENRHDEITQLSHDINKMLERLENENIRHQEMERRLVMNEKLVATGRLAANIAHEINNPLFAISNSLAVIKKQIKNPSSDIVEVLPLAEKEIKRVRKITRKLLDYGKINLETFKESDIDSILETACRVLKLSKQIKNTVIVRNKKSGELPIFCNPDSLQQVFMNLILNASEAMNGRGEIAIKTERRGAAYEIHFRDSGPGFPVAVKRRIFEPFNSSKETKGAGLGLYISYHIITRHGGSMTMDETCQSGAHLIVTLPRRGGTENA